MIILREKKKRKEVCDKNSEGVSGPDVFQFLRYLRRSSFEITGDAFLFVRFDGIELFAQITVDNVFYGIIIRSERKMIPSAERWMLASHVHLQMLEEVVILVARERH